VISHCDFDLHFSDDYGIHYFEMLQKKKNGRTEASMAKA